MATSRPRRSSRARQTSPAPPEPSNRTTMYAPTRSPGTKAPSVSRELLRQRVERRIDQKLARACPLPGERQHLGAQRLVGSARACDELGSRFGRALRRRRTAGRAVASARCHAMPPPSAPDRATRARTPSPCAPCAATRQRLGRLFHRQPAEESELHDPRLARIFPCQPLERLIDRDQIGVRLARRQVDVVERHRTAPAAAASARRRLAMSTSTRRIICAETPKKWPRFCQRA